MFTHTASSRVFSARGDDTALPHSQLQRGDIFLEKV